MMWKKHDRLEAYSTLFAAFIFGCTAEPSSVKSTNSIDVVHSEAASFDWPRLHGPRHDNYSSEKGLRFDWGKTGPPVLWRLPLGSGYSSPVVASGNVIVHFRRDDKEFVACHKLDSGDRVWVRDYPTTYRCRYEYSSGPYATPTVSDGRVYTVGAEAQFNCFELSTGKTVWTRNLALDFEMQEWPFAVGASPLVHDDVLIYPLGARNNAGIVALEKSSGRTRWASTNQGPSYATPRAATIHGRPMIFAVTREGLVALDPQDGREYWSEPFQPKAPDSINATSPLVSQDCVLMVTGPGPGSLCLQVLPDGSQRKLWRDRRLLDSQFNSLALVGDCAFGFTSRRQGGGIFRCVSLTEGKLRWEWKSGIDRGSVIALDDVLILWGEHGHLAALHWSRSRVTPLVITEAPLLPGPCYSAPALCGGRLIVRNEVELVCVELLR